MRADWAVACSTARQKYRFAWRSLRFCRHQCSIQQATCTVVVHYGRSKLISLCINHSSDGVDGQNFWGNMALVDGVGARVDIDGVQSVCQCMQSGCTPRTTTSSKIDSFCMFLKMFRVISSRWGERFLFFVFCLGCQNWWSEPRDFVGASPRNHRIAKLFVEAPFMAARVPLFQRFVNGDLLTTSWQQLLRQ
jgi:hypothetical protein